MAETSSIEWTDATWQIVTGCSIETPGCTNCYAMRLAGSRLRNHPSRAGLTRETKAGPVWTGEVRFNEAWLLQPLLWTRGRNIFVAAHGDLFHPGVPDAMLDRIFAVMAASSQHTFQVLTKRSARARAYLSAPDVVARIIAALEGLGRQVGDAKHSRDPRVGAGWNCWAAAENLKLGNERSSWPLWPLQNVWLGVSAEDQRRADERVPDLLATPAAVRFVSAEPLLGPIDFRHIAVPCDAPQTTFFVDALTGFHGARYSPHLTASSPIPPPKTNGLDWIITGGESGPGARPMDPAWARQIRDACASARTAFLHKQNGAWAPGSAFDHIPSGRSHDFGDPSRGDAGSVWLVGKKAAGRLLDGMEHNAFPEARHD